LSEKKSKRVFLKTKKNVGNVWIAVESFYTQSTEKTGLRWDQKN